MVKVVRLEDDVHLKLKLESVKRQVRMSDVVKELLGLGKK